MKKWNEANKNMEIRTTEERLSRAFKEWCEIILSAAKKTTPRVPIRRGLPNVWWTPMLERLARQVRNRTNRHQRKKDLRSWRELKIARAKFKAVIKKAKRRQNPSERHNGTEALQ